ncbi:MAG: 30S ribosomal protein S17e [Methanomicrobiales archaeon]|nr:30S ribosomal protein S17e [Methanomicrobiales archaeon]MDD1660057.1 30S ribosomal protein S17e [Methanomicrobiales archaeon]
MGIKPSYIKSIGRELLIRHPERFGREFSQNKQAVAEGTVIDSKGVRNRIAGFITRQINTGKHS